MQLGLDIVPNPDPSQIETDNSRVRETWLTQAQLLNNLSMLYSGDKRFLEVAQAHWGSFIVQTRRNHSLKEPVRPTSLDLMPLSGSDLEAKWHQWRHEEARTRLGYMVWVCHTKLSAILTSILNPLGSRLATRHVLRYQLLHGHG